MRAKRRRAVGSLGWLLGVVVCLAMVSPTLAGERQNKQKSDSVIQQKRPNILVIVSEDNGCDLGCYGNRFVRTPNLDRLAAEGVRFDRAFVPQAGCSQSRAAYLTGLYPHANGQIGLATWKFRMYRSDTPNIIGALKEAGYRTGMVGKLHVNPESSFPLDFHAIHDANFGRKKLDRYAEAAADFIGDDTSGKPFFLAVNYPDAHIPFIRQAEGLPKQPLTGEDVEPLGHFGLDSPTMRQRTADYYNCVNRLDTLIGDLLETLRTAGHADDTLVVYFGDHGSDTLRGKRTCFEAGVRIPLIVRWPGVIAPGQVCGELVSTVDLFPTFREAADLPELNTLQGKSLMPLFRGCRDGWREFLFTEFHYHHSAVRGFQRAVRDERFKLIHNLLPGTHHDDIDRVFARDYPPGEPERAMKNAPVEVRAAYERMRQPPEFELYDLQADPYEFRNLAGNTEYAGTLKRLQKALATWREETNDPFLNRELLDRVCKEVEATRGTDGQWQRPKKYWSFYDVMDEYQAVR